jgi:hypothetical protein
VLAVLYVRMSKSKQKLFNIEFPMHLPCFDKDIMFIVVFTLQIFYTMTAVEDLDEWQQKTVGNTESADLTSLEKYAQYALAVAARTKAVSLVHIEMSYITRWD